MQHKRSVIILLVLIVFIFFASLVVSKNINRALENERDRKVNVISNYSFEFELIKEANKYNKKNYLISPYSIKIALNMLKDGADNESYEQIEKVLRNSKYNNIKNDDVAIANGLFVRDRYRNVVMKDYIDDLRKNYKADVIFDPFKGPDKINDWVNDKTKKMIPTLLEDLDSDFVLAIVNALAIDVKWEKAFDCERTREESFNKDDNTVKKVAMMHDYNSNGKYFETDKAKGIILPYKGSKAKGLELIAILPNGELSKYIDELDEKEIKNIDDYKLKDDMEISLSLPKFTYDYDWEKFMSALIDMGIKDVFNSSKADLGKMLKNAKGNFYVSKAIHKTHIELDEKGTKAAAATGFVVSKNSVAEANVKEIKFDKPFAYIIRDKATKEMIFFGTVYEPNKWEGSKCDGDEK